MNLKCRNVEGSHKLVHQFRHQVDICFVTPLWRIEQLDQSKSLEKEVKFVVKRQEGQCSGNLCCSSDGNNKARDGRAGEVHPPTLSEKHHALATAKIMRTAQSSKTMYQTSAR